MHMLLAAACMKNMNTFINYPIGTKPVRTNMASIRHSRLMSEKLRRKGGLRGSVNPSLQSSLKSELLK